MVSLEFSVLKNESELATGDPITCSTCKAILNKHSKVASETWICEFCSKSNEVGDLEEEERPSTEAVNYILESAAAIAHEEMKGAGENLETAGKDEVIIFCIDVSGSMCVTKNVKGKIQLKVHSSQEDEELKKL